VNYSDICLEVSLSCTTMLYQSANRTLRLHGLDPTGLIRNVQMKILGNWLNSLIVEWPWKQLGEIGKNPQFMGENSKLKVIIIFEWKRIYVHTPCYLILKSGRLVTISLRIGNSL